MLLSWLEEDVTSERTIHSHWADAIAIAACLAAAAIAHHHARARSEGLFAAAKAPHALAARHQAHLRRV